MRLGEVLDALAESCAQRRNATALLETTGRRMSYAELGNQVDTVAANLRSIGFQPGDRVLFAVRPSLEAIVLILAVFRAGGVLVAADPGMGEAVFAARMALVQPRWTIAESLLLALGAWAPVRALLGRRGIALPNIAGRAATHVVRVGRRWPGVPASTSFERLLAPASTDDVLRRIDDPDSAAFIVFTSGTTDAPKAVVHTSTSLGASVAILATYLAFRATDVAYAGELHVIVPALLAGARVVIPRYARFSARQFMRDVDRYGVTHAFRTPGEVLEVVSFARAHRQRLPAHLRELMLGAAPVDRAFLSRIHDVVAATTRVACVYAMTEMLPVAFVTMAEKLARTGLGDLVGTPFPGVHARLAPDGELLLRGPHLFAGYFGQPPLEEHATGDLATLDAQGRIVLLGRKKDMIIRGQHNVYPGLYEPTIATIPGVRRCSLLGVYSDTIADERIVLVVEPDSNHGLAELERRLRAELRSGPRSIDLAAQPDAIVFTRLPIAGRSSKVDKRALLELVRAQLATC